MPDGGDAARSGWRRVEFDVAHAARRVYPCSRVSARAVVSALSYCILLSACGPETRTDTPWDVTFACAADAERTESVEVAISPGSCGSPASPVYQANIQRGNASSPPAPPDPLVGLYAFSATAFDSEGQAVSAVCLDVMLPRERGVSLILPGPPGCEPASPSGGGAGDPPDDHPIVHPSDSGVAPPEIDDASAPATDAGEPPITDPAQDAGPCVGPCGSAPIYSSPTHDISLPKQCWAPGEFMPVTIHIPVAAKDWLWVKNHPDYGGSDQEFWDNTGITTAGEVYRGGMREPGGLHAPSITGPFNITWHPNDASDKEIHSTLSFTVSTACP